MTVTIETVNLTTRTVVCCNRCKTRTRAGNCPGWNIVWKQGFITAFLCPACQTPEENAEAEINDATLEYAGADAFGRSLSRIKGGAQ